MKNAVRSVRVYPSVCDKEVLSKGFTSAISRLHIQMTAFKGFEFKSGYLGPCAQNFVRSPARSGVGRNLPRGGNITRRLIHPFPNYCSAHAAQGDSPTAETEVHSFACRRNRDNTSAAVDFHRPVQCS